MVTCMSAREFESAAVRCASVQLQSVTHLHDLGLEETKNVFDASDIPVFAATAEPTCDAILRHAVTSVWAAA